MTKEKRRASGGNWMANVLAAVGALMFAAGLYGIVTGSRIVQVEAGWTSVIAGSVLLVGGVLTVALAFVLRALNQLKSGLQIRALASSTAQTEEPQTPAFETSTEVPKIAQEPTTGLEPGPAGEPIQVEEPVSATEPASNNGPVASDDPIEAEQTVVYRPPSRRPPPLRPVGPTRVTSTSSVPRPSLFRKKTTPPSPEDATAEAAPAIDPLTFGEPRGVASAEPEPTPVVQDALSSISPEVNSAEAAHPADDFKIDRSTHEPPAAPHSQVPALSGVESVDKGWLDRALADIEEATPKHEREHASVAESHSFADAPAQDFERQELEPQEPILQPLESEQLEPQHFERQDFEPERAYAGPEPSPTLPAAPTLRPTPTAAVIGRYEADGTSYVMYADGSIEAHSEMGVYRFASMTELKAFMEA